MTHQSKKGLAAVSPDLRAPSARQRLQEGLLALAASRLARLENSVTLLPPPGNHANKRGSCSLPGLKGKAAFLRPEGSRHSSRWRLFSSLLSTFLFSLLFPFPGGGRGSKVGAIVDCLSLSIYQSIFLSLSLHPSFLFPSLPPSPSLTLPPCPPFSHLLV